MGSEIFRVDIKIADLENFAPGTRRSRAPLEVGVDAGYELLHTERLGYVVVGPGLEAPDLVHLGVLGGNHDDNYVPILLTDPLADPYPRLPGEHDVEQNKVGPKLAGQLQGLGPVRRLMYAEALAAKVVRQGIEDHHVDLDDQNLRCG